MIDDLSPESSPLGETQYLQAPGLDVVRLGDDRYLLRTEFGAHELSGASAPDVVEKLVLRLEEPMTMRSIFASLQDYDSNAVTRQVESLLAEGVLVRVPDGRTDDHAFAAFAAQVGLGAEAVRALQAATVAVLGLEAHGAHLAVALAQAGVGGLLLVDPFDFEAAHLSLTPVSTRDALTGSRQAALARLLDGHPTDASTPVEKVLDQAAVEQVVSQADLVVACFDRGLGVVNHWVNRAALASGTPALFSDLRASSYYAGPAVIPGHSACYMCYRMRVMASESDFERAMALEEHFDAQRRPRLHERSVLPGLPSHLASVLSLEIVRQITGIAPATLVDRVIEFEGLTSSQREHSLLPKHDCPVCGKKKGSRRQPAVDELSFERPRQQPDLEVALVSGHCGVLLQSGPVAGDPSEPHLPHVWRASMSNHRFLAAFEDERAMCSGKGFDLATARMSALCEAVERYSGGCWSESELTWAKASELEGSVLDPRSLVLYADDQYETLPYARYSAETAMNWVEARSLVSGATVKVPAIAVLMDYDVRTSDEFLFPITSNGLAAGPSLGSAVLYALYEVLERDAFLLSWCNRLPGVSYPAIRHPHDGVRGLAEAYRRRGVRLLLIELPTDHPAHAVMGVAIQERGEGPAAVVGLGADADLLEAARQAAIEVAQVRPALKRRAAGEESARVRELAADPSKVETLDDHALLYCDPSMSFAFDFLEGEEREWPSTSEDRPPDDVALGRMVEHFRKGRQDVLYFDLTPPEMESLSIFTARVVVPDFQPIWFGRGERRIGGDRMFRFPTDQGITRASAVQRTADQLNPLPHPLA